MPIKVIAAAAVTGAFGNWTLLSKCSPYLISFCLYRAAIKYDNAVSDLNWPAASAECTVLSIIAVNSFNIISFHPYPPILHQQNGINTLLCVLAAYFLLVFLSPSSTSFPCFTPPPFPQSSTALFFATNASFFSILFPHNFLLVPYFFPSSFIHF